MQAKQAGEAEVLTNLRTMRKSRALCRQLRPSHDRSLSPGLCSPWLMTLCASVQGCD